MSYWPFSGENQNKEQTPSSHNTRSTGQPLLPPLPAAGRAQKGPRSPAALTAPGRQEFFPPDLVVEPPSPSNFEDSTPSSPSIMAEAAQAAAQTEIDRLQRIANDAIQAATAATLALQAVQQRSKKPELPPFDKKNVELWIKRVESAYLRAGVHLLKEKFAHLEPKFPVDFSAKVNDFLFGADTEDRWQEFLAYLKKEYGRTPRQQAATLLAAHPRSGLKPTAFMVNLKDKTNKITLDDVYKEILFKSIPADVQHILVDKWDDWTADQAAEAADKFFDNEGRPLSSSSSSSVNAVDDQLHQDSPNFTAAFSQQEDQEDVNAVSFRRFSRDNKFGGNRGFNNSFKKQPSSNTSSTRPQNSSRNPIGSNGLCFVHDRHGDRANLCFPGCSRFATHKGKKATQGNGQASRRT